MSGLMTAQQVAERWQCSAEHVRSLCRTGRLRAMRLGVDWRISPADLERFEAGNTSAADAEQVTRSGDGGGYRQPAVQRPAVELGGEYHAVVKGPVPWRSTVLDAASPAAGSGRTARTKKRLSARN